MNEQVKKLTDFINKNNQFEEDSDLWKSIYKTLYCTKKQAKEYATTHCNLVSFYAILYCQNLVTISYSDFFRKLLNNKSVDNYGYFNLDKEVVLKLLNIKCNIISTPFGVNYHAGFYQLKITNYHGDHFIACYSENYNLYICDTGGRGIGVSLETGLKSGDKKQWVKQYEVN